MKPVDYFATHAVFRFDDFASAHRKGDVRRPATSLAALKQHVHAGNLLRIRRGLYAVVPRGQTPETVAVDPYVVASLLAPDGTPAWSGASNTERERYMFISSSATKAYGDGTPGKTLW